MSKLQRKLYQHGKGSKPMDRYAETDMSDKEKLFTDIITKTYLGEGMTKIWSSSLHFGEQCGFIEKGFRSNYITSKKSKQLTEEQVNLKLYVERKVNKGIHGLVKLGFIDTVQTYISTHGSRRTITVNKEFVEKLYSEFNPNITSWEHKGEVFTIEKNRGLILVLRKFIRNRIFSFVTAVKKHREQFNKFINYQGHRAILNGLIAFGGDNEEMESITDLFKVEYDRLLNKKELDTIRKSKFNCDQWKLGLLKAIQVKKQLSIVYIHGIIKNDSQPIKDMSYFDGFCDEVVPRRA